MGSKAGDVWKFVVPVLPCGSSRKKFPACLRRSPAATASSCKSSASPPVDLSSALQQVRGEISAVGARVSYVDEQMEHIKAALPDLDSKIRYASLGMPVSSLSLEEMLHLKEIHFKLLQFWEELCRKQLEKLGVLSDCLQVLEEQRKSQLGEEHSGHAGSEALEESYQELEQHVSEKVASDLRKNQELEMKLYVDRISSVSDVHSKPYTALLPQIPPERGPQAFASEQQMGKKLSRGGESKLQSETRLEQQLVLNPKKAATPPPPPTSRTPPSTPSGIAAAAAGAAAPSSTRSLLPRLAMRVPRCKAEREAASAPAGTPVQRSLRSSSVEV